MHGFNEGREEIVDEDWQTRDVVNVRVRDDAIANLFALRVGRRERKASGVKRDTIVNQ